MLITNYYKVNLTKSDLKFKLFNDVKKTEGKLWEGFNVQKDGVIEEIANDAQVLNITEVFKYKGQVIAKIFGIEMPALVETKSGTYIRINTSLLGLDSENIKGAKIIGICNPHPDRKKSEFDMVGINFSGMTNYEVGVINGALEVRVIGNNQPLLRNKILNILLFHV